MTSTIQTLSLVFLVTAILTCCLSVHQVCLSPVGLPNLDKLLKYRALIMVIGILHGIEYIFTTIHVFFPANTTVIFANHLVYVIISFLKSIAAYIISTETIEALYRQRKHQDTPQIFIIFFKLLVGSYDVSLVITSLLSLATTRMVFWNVHFLYTNICLAVGCFVVFIALFDVVYFLNRNMNLARTASARALDIKIERTPTGEKSDDEEKPDVLQQSVQMTLYKLAFTGCFLLALSIQQAVDIPEHVQIIVDRPNASVFDPRFATSGEFVAEYLKDTLLIVGLIAWLFIPSCELDQYSVCNILCFAELPDEVDGQIVFPPKNGKDPDEDPTYRDTITANPGSMIPGNEPESLATRTRKSTVTRSQHHAVAIIHSDDEDDPIDTIPEETGDELKRLILYDFDQTLTRHHLYQRLNGGKREELDKLSDASLINVFGGEDRLERLERHLAAVRPHATLIVISHGWTEVIQSALERVRLAHFFEHRIQSEEPADNPALEKLGALLSENENERAGSVYRIIGKDATLMRTGDKHSAILTLMGAMNLKKKQVLFIDDDTQNINSIEDEGLCETVLVSGLEGMTEENFEFIEDWVPIIR